MSVAKRKLQGSGDEAEVKRSRRGQQSSGADSGVDTDELGGPGSTHFSDPMCGVMWLRGVFPKNKFCLPPLLLKHQLLTVLPPPLVDSIDALREARHIKVLELGAHETVLTLTRDYVAHVRRCTSDWSPQQRLVIEKFLARVVEGRPDICVSGDVLLHQLGFTESDITLLVGCGVLCVREAGTWRVSVPGSGSFSSALVRGRNTLVTMVKRSKFSQVLQTELECRKWPRGAKLGLIYHIYDAIGANIVDHVDTPAGRLLRIKDNN